MHHNIVLNTIMSSDKNDVFHSYRSRHPAEEQHDEKGRLFSVQDTESGPVSQLRDNDVLLGRGKSNVKHPGNLRFQGKQYLSRLKYSILHR